MTTFAKSRVITRINDQRQQIYNRERWEVAEVDVDSRRLWLVGIDTEPLLTAEEAAQLLHVPRSTLYELVRSRHLPHVRVGRSLRFTRSQLAMWVDSNTFR